MSYQTINFRLKEIREEIHELREKAILPIQEKIEILKSINILLREQNQLLYRRQEILMTQQCIVSTSKIPFVGLREAIVA